MPEEKKISIDELIASIKETREEVSQTKLEAAKAHEKTGNFYYECERVEQALDGTIENLDPLSGHVQPTREGVVLLFDTSGRLQDYFEEKRNGLHKTVEIFTDSSTASASGSMMLANSANLYAANAESLVLPPAPPSIQKGIDPYATDQEDVEKELTILLETVDQSLSKQYSELKTISKTPYKEKLAYASGAMRTLIWKIFRQLAPHDKVCASPGFVQNPEKDLGVPTRRQQVAYIMTGEADLKGAKAALIDSIFATIDEALGTFSGRIKALGAIPDEQIRMNMVACARALLALLKNRKV